MAARPADDDHPYGHGRYEAITGLMIGLIFTCSTLSKLSESYDSPASRGTTLPLVDAVKVCFAKYADFEGRASRNEYWWFFLAVLIEQRRRVAHLDADLRIVRGPDFVADDRSGSKATA
jgi:hypothetical protein